MDQKLKRSICKSLEDTCEIFPENEESFFGEIRRNKWSFSWHLCKAWFFHSLTSVVPPPPSEWVVSLGQRGKKETLQPIYPFSHYSARKYRHSDSFQFQLKHVLHSRMIVNARMHSGPKNQARANALLLQRNPKVTTSLKTQTKLDYILDESCLGMLFPIIRLEQTFHYNCLT